MEGEPTVQDPLHNDRYDVRYLLLEGTRSLPVQPPPQQIDLTRNGPELIIFRELCRGSFG